MRCGLPNPRPGKTPTVGLGNDQAGVANRVTIKQPAAVFALVAMFAPSPQL